VTGDGVGCAEGCLVGPSDGEAVGILLGLFVGHDVGCTDGVEVGTNEGRAVGECEGCCDGYIEGRDDGAEVGSWDTVGDVEGSSVGVIVHVPHSTSQEHGHELTIIYSCLSSKPIASSLVHCNSLKLSQGRNKSSARNDGSSRQVSSQPGKHAPPPSPSLPRGSIFPCTVQG